VLRPRAADTARHGHGDPPRSDGAGASRMITGRDGSTGLRAIGRELVPLAATLAFMGGLSWVLWERMTEPNLRPGHTRIGNVVMASASFEERCGAAELALVDVIHGEDGASWIEEGTA